MPNNRMSHDERVRIIECRKQGDTLMDISTRFSRSKSTICRLLSRAKGLPEEVVPDPIKASGRPRKLTNGLLRLIQLQLIKDPWLTAAELKNFYEKELKDVSIRSIQHRCRVDLKMPIRRACKKPLLTARMRAQRMQFAREMQYLTEKDWEKVMWSDESMFKCISNRRFCVRRPRIVSRHHPRYTQRTVKHPYSVMIWGAFSGGRGRAGLEYLPKGVTMNATRYKRILIKHLNKDMNLHGCNIFMHDKAPCHTANIVKKWFSNKGIRVMSWPGNSPDLNPIENAWNLMKNKVFKQGRNMSVGQLKETIASVWNDEMDVEYFRKLSDSMPRRIKAVLKANGHMTKY